MQSSRVRLEVLPQLQELRPPLEIERDVLRLHAVIARLGQAAGPSFARACRESVLAAMTRRDLQGHSLTSDAAAWLFDSVVAPTGVTGASPAPNM